MSDSLSASPTRVLTPSAAEADGDAALPAWVGRYHILGEIARGGMGVVARAHDSRLGRDLAVKMLLPQHREQPELAMRFLAEAQVMARLQHPGVPAVHEVGQLPDGRPFIAMKLVEGRTFAALLGRSAASRDELPRLLAVFEQVCQTMAFAHSRGVTHCDLKPSNVMVGAFGEVQVMDWGLASAEDATEAPPTEAGDVFGTPAYMPPEQARGEHARIGPACDVFALGAILCEILTGRPPYQGDSTTRVFARAAGGDVDDALQRLDGCGAEDELVRLASSCLAPGPQDRPADAAAVADALTRYQKGVRERLRTVELERARAQAREATRRRARWQRFALAALVLVISLMLVGAWAWRAREGAAQDRDRAAAAADVESNLQEAARLQSEAKWADAKAALARAEGKLDRCGADDLRRRVRQVRADLEMVARLDEAAIEETQVRDGMFDTDGAAVAFASAFHDYGIDFDAVSPEESARRIRESAVRDPLIAGLNQWCMEAPPELPYRDRLFTAANLADSDDWRVRFRNAVHDRDRAEMGRLVEAADAASPPRETAVLLSQAPLAPARPAELAALRAVQSRFPDEFFINDQLGQTLRLMRPPQAGEALGFLRVAVALRPESPGARLNLGGALLELDRPEEAEACFREALRLKPDYGEALYCRGEALDRLGRYPEARGAFEDSLRLRPERSDAHNGLGNVLLHSGDPEAAAAEYREAERLDPHNESPHYNLALRYQQKNDPESAIAEYRLAIGCNPNRALSHYNLGTLLLNHTEQFAEAADEFREAIRCAPDYAEACCNLGQALQRQQRFHEALDSLRRGHALGQKRGDAWRYPSAEWVRNAEMLVRLDDRLDAVQQGADPSGSPAEIVQLAQFCQQVKQRYALAADLYTQALDRAPDLAKDLTDDWRYQAACAAVQASAGQGVGAPESQNRQAEYRRAALKWLRADLASWMLQAPTDVRRIAAAWHADVDLAGVRDAKFLAGLQVEDAAAWRAFWADVDAAAAADGAP